MYIHKLFEVYGSVHDKALWKSNQDTNEPFLPKLLVPRRAKLERHFIMADDFLVCLHLLQRVDRRHDAEPRVELVDEPAVVLQVAVVDFVPEGGLVLFQAGAYIIRQIDNLKQSKK